MSTSASGEVIAEGTPDEESRGRLTDIFRRYAAGESMREIGDAIGLKKQTVSYHLHRIEDMTGKPFLRVQAPSVRKAVREHTQAKRERGQRAASVRDWHALRTTWVTLALASGRVSVETVKVVTGHGTVETVLKHYFKPGREHFKRVLHEALPDVLTGVKRKRLPPAEELAALAAKVAAGSATENDKTRLRKLAAKVK